MDAKLAVSLVENTWEGSIIPTLEDYIRIPNKSPVFDRGVGGARAHGDRDRGPHRGLVQAPGTIPGLAVEVMRLEGRTPLIYMEIPGEGEGTVLLYGHLDKQPEMVGLARGPRIPGSRCGSGEKLYGRGGADDGYAAFASLTALRGPGEVTGGRTRAASS